MKRAILVLAALASGAMLLSACKEKPQTNAEGVKHDATPWSGTGMQANTGTVFTAPGWKVGEQRSWEQQIKLRSNNQNEYTREN